MASLFIGRFAVDPARREEFLKVFREIAAATEPLLKEATTVLYWGWTRDDAEFLTIESWRDEATVNALRATDDFKQAYARMMSCCTGPMRIELVRPMEGGREVFDLYPRGQSAVHPIVNGLPTIFQ